MTAVYVIRDWNKNFEKAQSRKVDGPLDWVAIPTKHDGKGYGRIMLLDEGPTIYAAWTLLVQVAAKCPVRGVLADHDGPLTTTDLAIKTKCPESVFQKALAALSAPTIGWLMVAEWETAGIQLPPQDRTGQDKTRQEDCGTAASTPPRPPASDPREVAYPAFPCIPGKRSDERVWTLTEANVAELACAFESLDVSAECRKAHAWVRANLDRRKTAGRMQDFLFRWLARAQNGNGARRPKAPESRLPTAEDDANWTPYGDGA